MIVPGNMKHWMVAWIPLTWLVVMATADYVDVPPVYPAQDKQKFAFACENSYIHIKCHNPQEKIRVLLANYGRFSLVVCNQDAVSKGWDLKCSSKLSMEIVSQKCDGRPHCTFNATNGLFGDPCPSTKKYMEIHYICEKENTKAPINTSVTPDYHVVTTQKPEVRTTTEAATTTLAPRSKPADVTKRPMQHKNEKICQGEAVDGIYWPDISEGTVVHKECPTQMLGEARWECGKNGKWRGQPDLSDCVSTWMADIQDLVDKDAPVEDTVERLNKHLRGPRLGSGDLKLATSSVIPGLVERMKTQIKDDMSANLKREKIQSFNKEIVKTGSSLLSLNQSNSWSRLEPADQKKSATSLIVSLEKMALEVASTLEYETLSSKEENIVMEVSVIKMATVAGNHPNLQLPELHHEGPDMGPHNFSLPLDGLPGITNSDDITVTYLFYNNLDQLMNPSSPDNHGIQSRSVGSNIISASILRRNSPVNSPHMKMGLHRPMNFTLAHKQKPQDKVPVCAYWKYNYSTMIGEWATDGCHVVMTTEKFTTCQCNHLTNFAILMDASGTQLHRYHQMSLQAITYVGCSVSIICLLMCFISFSVFRNLQSDRNTIHKNLVLCLMLANILFLFGVGETELDVVCKVIAMCLHFLFLACFSWMCLEGAQLYFMLIEVFEAERSRVRWFYLFGYGVPAIIVGTSAAVFHEGYGTENHCWLTTDRLFILSFVIPVAIVVCINIVMLSIAMYMMCRHAGVTASSIQSRKKGTLEKMGKDNRNGNNYSYYSDTSTKTIDMPTWLKGSAILVVLLGLTWVFGFLYVNAETVVMAYLFTIFNSLQGLFIFIFHCFMDRKVKKEWRKAVYKAKWLPVCCRVNLGGYHGNFSSPTPTSSSGPQNYILKFWSSRKRKRSSASSTATKRRSDLDSFLRSDTSSGCTVGTGLNRYSNQSDKLLPNGGNPYSPLPTHYEGGVVGDLSVVDCSVVDSEFVTEYCQQGLKVCNEKRRYSSGSDDDIVLKDNISHTSVNKNRLSYLSNDSALKQPSDFTSDSEDTDHQNIDYSVLQTGSVKKSDNRNELSENDRNKVNDILNMYENTKESHLGQVQSLRISSSQERINTSGIVGVDAEGKAKSTPNLKVQIDSEGYSNPILESSTHPLLGSVPNVEVEEEGRSNNQS